MKKITIIFSVIAVSLFPSCGGKNSESNVIDSDTVAVNPADMIEAEATTAYLTKDSIGCIAIGMELAEIPDSIGGLYSSKNVGESHDAMSIEFFEDQAPRFVVYDFGEGKIDVINLIGSSVKVATINGDLGIGDPMDKVLNLPGVKAEWCGFDDGGMWYWIADGIWYAPDQSSLTAELSHRLYHSGQAPTVKDFENGNVSIGFIGTGLPF